MNTPGKADMRIQIVARHCEVPASIRERAHEQLPKLVKYDPRLSSAEVIFQEERHVKRVEGVLTVDGGGPVVARSEGGEFRGALDGMLSRLARILRRRRSQVMDHQAPKLSEVVQSEIDRAEE
jgi:ribosomal subunit interface protein